MVSAGLARRAAERGGPSSFAFHSTAPTSTVRRLLGLPPERMPTTRSSTAEPSAVASSDASQVAETTTRCRLRTSVVPLSLAWPGPATSTQDDDEPDRNPDCPRTGDVGKLAACNHPVRREGDAEQKSDRPLLR